MAETNPRDPVELARVAEQLALNGVLAIRSKTKLAKALGVSVSTLFVLLKASKQLRRIVRMDETGRLVADAIEIRDYLRSLPSYSPRAS